MHGFSTMTYFSTNVFSSRRFKKSERTSDGVGSYDYPINTGYKKIVQFSKCVVLVILSFKGGVECREDLKGVRQQRLILRSKLHKSAKKQRKKQEGCRL
jgi:hypothetical protein